MNNTIFNFKILLFICTVQLLHAQTGLTVSPPRTYFKSASGEGKTEKLLITNPSKTSTLNLTVSLNDWKYDTTGNNLIADPGTYTNSMSSWITIGPEAYFTLAPGESHELLVTVTPPAKKDSLNTHTALLFITQTNPVDSFNDKGALIKVSVRTGVKLYHQYSDIPEKQEVDYLDFKFEKENKTLFLTLQNTGNSWTDGTLETELINQATGEKLNLEDQIMYTMPGDTRHVRIPLPAEIKPGKYIATSTFSYGETDTIKMAELTFTYE
ncbi:fimbrial biogenesis chaperone [Planobacterium oryzisoli]|uniref:Molecular chaperone n=1 Tax=Planobacterium oryzisoli TaxID=2771435 RepID=A0A931E5S3_9FLAO|nr:molecular chaperone [Planobacterium oryzisoli]MBF5027200.1 molecular chaperone [Planobacterium oryzisoli]